MKVHSHLFRCLSLVSLCQSWSSRWFYQRAKSRCSWSVNYACCKPLHNLDPPRWSNLDTWQSFWAMFSLLHLDLTLIVKQLFQLVNLRAILLFIRELQSYRILRCQDGAKRRKYRLCSRFQPLKSRFCGDLRLFERISELRRSACHWSHEFRDLLLWV